MDEIIIEEKKYISSKRAAKATGYAKDYIGQLCREGRVPARLVGRNWYVLETAIQDHRFGSPVVAPERDAKASEPSPEFESPRYEALSADAFPQIAHSRQDGSEPIPANDNRDDAPQHLQDSWKEWFERIADTTASVIPDVAATEKSSENVKTAKERKKEAVAGEREEEAEEVKIPIRAIHHSRYQAPPEEFLPRRHGSEREQMHIIVVTNDTEQAVAKRVGTGKGAIRAIRAIAVSIAFLSVALAVIGTGYLDAYIISYNQASVITGISVYNR